MIADGKDNSEELRVLIADDHRLLGEAVANLLRTGAGYTVGTAETFDTTISALAAHKHDIVLLDLKMPGMVGLASVRTVIEKAGDAKVVLFTGQVDRHSSTVRLIWVLRGSSPKRCRFNP